MLFQQSGDGRRGHAALQLADRLAFLEQHDGGQEQDAVLDGLILIVVEVGLITPPVGMNVFVINKLAQGVPMSQTFRGVVPFLISDAIRLCGGENVFGALPQLAPKVGVESVLAADPEVIVASGMGEARPDWLDQWKRWPKLAAAAADNLYFIPPELIQRHTPRILDGAAQLCEFLDEARSRRRPASAGQSSG